MCKGNGNGKGQWNLTIFIRRRKDGKILMMLAKITDDQLLAGAVGTMEGFVREVSGIFKVIMYIINVPINFNGTRIEQDEEGNIRMRMDA